MRRLLVIAAIAALPVLGIAGPAAAADAAADACVGRQGTVGVCVGTKYTYLGCYYLGGDQCTHVWAVHPAITSCWLGDPSIIECA
jgi:hypothetical protein